MRNNQSTPSKLPPEKNKHHHTRPCVCVHVNVVTCLFVRIYIINVKIIYAKQSVSPPLKTPSPQQTGIINGLVCVFMCLCVCVCLFLR